MPESPPPLREVIARHRLSARRSLGQHFLLDTNLTARIARAAGDLQDRNVIEVGPGPGGLTRALLEAGARRVFAIERDGRCVAALEELAAAYRGRLLLTEGDALQTDAVALAPAPRCVVANLPYNIAVPLLLGWLRRAAEFEGLTLMFQKEVAGRLTATPGGKDYGRLSVLVQWLCEARIHFNVNRRAFTPPPEVTSTVVTLIPRRTPLAAADWESLEAVTAAAFGQRRKMLRSSLKPLGLDLEALPVDGAARAEELDVETFCLLARAHAARRRARHSGV